MTRATPKGSFLIRAPTSVADEKTTEEISFVANLSARWSCAKHLSHCFNVCIEAFDFVTMEICKERFHLEPSTKIYFNCHFRQTADLVLSNLDVLGRAEWAASGCSVVLQGTMSGL